MKIAFTSEGWEDYQYWHQNNIDNFEKVNKLIKEIIRDPFKGTGKPEPLRGNLSGYWSRRITGEHRLVYRIEGKKSSQLLIIIQARFHYS